MKKKLYFLIIIISLILLTGCSGFNTSEEISLIADVYSDFRDSRWKEAYLLSQDSKIIEEFLNNNPQILGEENRFSEVHYYDIQGIARDGSGESLRGTIPYQRLMGHMDYYLYLEELNGIATQSILVKLFDPDPTLVPMRFIGILKLSVPLQNFNDFQVKRDGAYIIDSNKVIVSLEEFSVISDFEEDSNLEEILKKISLMDEEEGKVRLDHSVISGTYYYRIENGFAVLVKK